MQEIPNYGSFLQAYALKQLILSLGVDEIEYISITPGKQIPEYSIKRNLSYYLDKRRLKTAFHYLSYRKDKLFSRELVKKIRNSWNLIGIGQPNKIEEFDLVIIGSDEVFNCCQVGPWGFSKQLFGDIPYAKKIATYAASFGHTTMADIERCNLTKDIINCLKNISKISVRDQNSYDIISNLINTRPSLNIDPVLAYDFNSIIEGRNDCELKDFVIVYTYPGRIHTENEIEAIKEFAIKNNKKLISIMCRYSWCDDYLIPETPFDVLRLFKKADYIVTDTFHGTIFSVITHSKFATIIRPSNENKLKSLLKTVGLEDREYNKDTALSKVLCSSIDYAQVESRLNGMREQTMIYLKSLLDI